MASVRPPERPVFHPELGTRFRQARDQRGWSVEQCVRRAQRAGFDTVTTQRVRYLEEGRLKHPDQKLLAAMAYVYGAEGWTYRDLVLWFVRANYGLSLDEVPQPEPLPRPLSPLVARVAAALEEIGEPQQEAFLGLLAVQGVQPSATRVAELAREPLPATRTTSGRAGRRRSQVGSTGSAEA